MLKYTTFPTHKVTVEISTSIFYPWEIGDYFRHQGHKYRIDRILGETKYASVNNTLHELSCDTSPENQVIINLVTGTLANH